MNKNIKKVRKGIEERKKARTQPKQLNKTSHYNSSLPQNEEKHGFLPLFTGEQTKSKSKHKQSFAPGLLLKGILALMLFLGTALMTEAETAWLSTPKQWLNTAITQEFPFATVSKWYQESFGTPLAFEPEENDTKEGSALPAGGQVVKTFKTEGTGVLLAPEEDTAVNAMKPGIVIFSGNDRQTGKTVVLQHADNSVSTYGHLHDIDVHIYQSVAAGEQMGGFDPKDGEDGFYFAVEKNNEPVDPLQVIQVDERP